MKQLIIAAGCVALASASALAQSTNRTIGLGSITNTNSAVGRTLNQIISGAAGAYQPQGIVTIEGNVPTEAAKEQISQQVQQVNGVTQVRNLLRVSGQANTNTTNVTTNQVISTNYNQAVPSTRP